jgi:hypothetical protein
MLLEVWEGKDAGQQLAHAGLRGGAVPKLCLLLPRQACERLGRVEKILSGWVRKKPLNNNLD